MRKLTLSLFALLAGCGVVYHSPNVREGVVDGAKVRIIELTPETLLAANSQAYNPRSLPAAFRASAGTYGSSDGMESLPNPAHSPEYRPGALETRLPPTPPNDPYRIGVGDVVLLATKTPGNTVSELSGLLAAENRRQGYTVQDDGTIAIPDVGRVRIADMTMEEAETTLFQRLVERQIDPTFSLEVAEFNARRVSIGGAVVNPGVAPITLTPLTLDTAMAKVGGVSAADRDSAVIRIYRDGSLYELPVEDFLRTPAYQKLRLIDGDSVFVDTEYDLAKAQAYFEEQIQLSSTRASIRSEAMTALSQEVAIRRQDLAEQRDNFEARIEYGAEKRDYVFLSGEVVKPGRWPLPYEQTASLADALYDSGGVQAVSGNPRQIYILRGSPDPREFGGITAWHLDGTSATGMMLSTRMQLRPDDVVFVAEQPVTKWDRVLDQISPSLITVPLDNATQ
ncbi:polysaccharide biosynthesis/export family protein [Paracoccus benzoatiresistens]|uniref:Polysaccharide biosynthesis/export family protein n=1 Tax=Paracoccus benzoatiresistens TaxID=2997341 RepID=A0ABT4JBA4_9RHOB|nr:polysaccharide biosynthesis/export family protein [Paracoccus sp. EF6]MCZ0964367.1 polysaccharide biosynthesis/export family protein [Paracoccus sp. EF6]